MHGLGLWVLRVVVALNDIATIGVSEEICDSSYFWTMVYECGPVLFLFLVCV
jgi:hypothetical protein